jgi:predicted aspartyl protease
MASIYPTDGSLRGSISPKIKLELYGMGGRPPVPRIFETIIDTGFTGGISIPLTQALPLGLVLFSTASFTLADGSKEDTLLCAGMARVAQKERPVTFSLTQGNEILLGTDFLATFKAKLELDYTTNTFSIKV